MTKRELIDRIRRLNPTARPDFLADFSEDDLQDYLHQLLEIEREQHGRAEPELVASS